MQHTAKETRCQWIPKTAAQTGTYFPQYPIKTATFTKYFSIPPLGKAKPKKTPKPTQNSFTYWP